MASMLNQKRWDTAKKHCFGTGGLKVDSAMRGALDALVMEQDVWESGAHPHLCFADCTL